MCGLSKQIHLSQHFHLTLAVLVGHGVFTLSDASAKMFPPFKIPSSMIVMNFVL